MNISKWLLLGLALFVPSVGWSQSQPAAPSQIDVDLQRLQTQRERALAAAAVPIDRQYQAALQQLLRAAMQRGDLDGALKAKTAIGGPTAATPILGTPATPSTALGNAIGAKRLAGTKWVRAHIHLTFGADGSFLFTYGRDMRLEGTWKATTAKAAEVLFSDGKKRVYRWDSETKLIDDTNNTYGPFTGDSEPPASGPKKPASSEGSGSPGSGDLFGKP